MSGGEKRTVYQRTGYPRTVSLRGAASRRDGERIFKESPHGDAADSDEVFSRRDSQWVAREPSHGKTASGWRGSHPIARRDSEQMTREPSHGDTGSVQRIVRILGLTSDRAFSGVAVSDRVLCMWTRDLLIETERLRNCLVHV